MKIHLVGKDEDKNVFWVNALNLAVPKIVTASYISLSEIVDTPHLEQNDIIFFISDSNELNDPLAKKLIESGRQRIVLCDEVDKHDIKLWLSKGLNAVITKHMSIEKIAAMIDIVDNDGIYFTSY